MTEFEELEAVLAPYGQQHVLQWWDKLTTAQRESLAEQIRGVDFETVQKVWEGSRTSDTSHKSGADRATRAQAPRDVVFQPTTDADRQQQAEATVVGEQLLKDGRVAVLTVAGGQGSRLGFDLPKGMFPIGPLSSRPLFQVFAEQILARRQRHGGGMPWLIMTSAATHDTTIEFFEQQDFFGLAPDTVFFFQQGSMPAVDAVTGKALMSDKASLCLSPDGHGGLVTALRASGLLKQLADAGIEHLFYHQVDNPTVIISDPALLGTHHLRRSQLTTNVVRKTEPTEKMGVLVEVDGRTEIIEYSELTPEQAAATDESGQWIFWAGNTAIHVFRRDFLEDLTADGCQLNLHVALKNVAFLDSDGNQVRPADANANKFERFIFDALPLADSALIIEGNRAREFNPVKNASGKDSPETARAALSRIGREWLRNAGVDVPESATAEISPLTALDQQQLAERIAAGTVEPATLFQLTDQD